jgi:hypothetical protein
MLSQIGYLSVPPQLVEKLYNVHPGMVIVQDVRTHMGTLLVARGFEVSSTFLERIRNFGPDLQNETVKVLVPPAKAV